MKICKVVGHVWATKKDPSLEGVKLMIVKPWGGSCGDDEAFVAGDLVGAGIGEKILVITGSSARNAFGSKACSIDSAIVGIIDAMEMEDAAEVR